MKKCEQADIPEQQEITAKTEKIIWCNRKSGSSSIYLS
jgi:hypothetical protein